MMSSHRRLKEIGQSVWLEDLRRDFLDDGSFEAACSRSLEHAVE